MTKTEHLNDAEWNLKTNELTHLNLESLESIPLSGFQSTIQQPMPNSVSTKIGVLKYFPQFTGTLLIESFSQNRYWVLSSRVFANELFNFFHEQIFYRILVKSFSENFYFFEVPEKGRGNFRQRCASRNYSKHK